MTGQSYSSNEVGLFQAPLEAIAGDFVSWQEKIFVELGFSVTALRGSGPIHIALDQLLPTSVPVTRHLFVATRSSWVAYFDNGPNGTDAAPVVSVLAERSRVAAVRVAVSPPSKIEAPTPSWLRQEPGEPAFIFEYRDGKSGSSRVLFSARDGGRWKHMSYGDAELKGGPAAVSRDAPLTFDGIKAIAGGLGAFPFDDAWFENDWILVEKRK